MSWQSTLSRSGREVGERVMQERGMDALPWAVSEAQMALLASGDWVGEQVAHWQARAQRVAHPHAGGHTVLHHWAPVSSNGLAPLVLFHGGSGSWTHWVRSIGPLLDAGHDVWAVDLPGFGDSDAPPDAVDADDLLPVLAEMLMQQFPAQTVRLLGFSFGAMTACMLAASYPRLVEQLVLVGAPGMGQIKKKAYALKGWRHLPQPQQQLNNHLFNLRTLMFSPDYAVEVDTVALHVHNVQRDNLPRRRISSTDIVLQSLAKVACPVAAIYGELDVLYSGYWPQVQALMAAQARQWQGLQCVAGTGHWVQYEQPESFHAALLPLLSSKV